MSKDLAAGALQSAFEESTSSVSRVPKSKGQDELQRALASLEKEMTASIESGEAKDRVRILNDMYKLMENAEMKIADRSKHQDTRAAVRQRRDVAIKAMKDLIAEDQAELASAERQRYMIYGGIGGLSLLAVVGILVFWYIKKKRARKAANFIVSSSLLESQSITRPVAAPPTPVAAATPVYVAPEKKIKS